MESSLSTGPSKKIPFFPPPVCLRGTSSRTVGGLAVGPGPKSRFNSAYCGPQGPGKGSCSLYSYPKENEQAPVIPLCNCCASTRRPIETGPIFRNSFMTFLTHMQFQGPELFTPGAVEFPLASLVLIFRFLLGANNRPAVRRKHFAVKCHVLDVAPSGTSTCSMHHVDPRAPRSSWAR